MARSHPLNASNGDVRVNVIAYWEIGEAKVQHCRWGTDLRVSTRNILHLMRGGRARWKIANETCKTLQNQGDHVAPNDGHGEQTLSVVVAMLMLLACWWTRHHSSVVRCCKRSGQSWAVNVSCGSG